MHVLRMERGTVRNEAEKPIRSRVSPIGFSTRYSAEAQGFRRALLALSQAYARVGDALSDRLQNDNSNAADPVALGASYGWVSDRRRLVQTYLEAEPAIMAYACADFGDPDQVRSLAEAAHDLAGESDALFSALGLLTYIDQELGWAAVGGAPAGNA